MKNKFLHGAAALALCAGFVACSEYDAGLAPETLADIKSLQYETAFVQKFGKIDPAQDWGFGSANVTETRAVMTNKWNGKHSDCKIDEGIFDFTVPAKAVDLTKGSFTDAEKKAVEFVIPASFNNGEEGDFTAAFNIPAGAKVYNLAKITAFNANLDGFTTFYNLNEMTYSISNGGVRHTVINTGVLTVTNYANIGDVYNDNLLILERAHNPYWENEGGTADVPNAMHIYSLGDVEMPDGGDLKAVCDIHGTLVVRDTKDENAVRNVKIQNSTRKHICGIDATGTVENVDGALETSYVHADVFSFDGNPIYLLPGGHVDVATLEVINSGCQFYGAENSNGLVEATNYKFGNKNDFTHTFSDNIYFKVNGGYVKVDNCYAMGQSHNFNNIADYLADTTHSDEFALAADRINADLNEKKIGGHATCGDSWGYNGNDDDDKIVKQGRVFCEDLGSIGDFDFNDVVFDAYIYESGKVEITLLAAGGTLPITVAGVDPHAHLGAGMVNTGVGGDDKTYTIKLSKEEAVNLGITVEGGLNSIPVVVSQVDPAGYNVDILLKTETGKAPQKICVPEGTKWMLEYEQINKGYPKFDKWVGNSSVGEKAFTDEVKSEYLYQKK